LPSRPADISINFTTLISSLENEFSRTQKTRKVNATDRAFLIRVETNPSGAGEKALEELKELARSCNVEVFDAVIQYRGQLDPRYVMGKGKLSEVVIRALQMGANLLIFDHELTTAQVRSIADFTEMKVIDRTQVILDIFAQRAHSREGKIQVELAQLKYLLPRLATKHTAMSRLTGGIGARGPGETKLEINRRRIRERIHILERQMKEIGKARGQRRVKRERTGLPIISIVGYTNAGKSTLLNALTQSRVTVEDRLFATLDPKSSRLRFPRDTEAIITDTVGFIRDLPKDLFAAFRATLDELHEAHLLIHVIDIGNLDFDDHISAVDKILDELDISSKPAILVFNKEDRFPDKSLLETLCSRYRAVAVSALDETTLPPLVEKMEAVLQGFRHD
jgi:GTPase